MDWKNTLNTIMEEHTGKLIGVLLGLLFGLFTIVFGFWKALFLAICIGIGFFVGQRMDEKKGFAFSLKKLWNK